MFAFPHCEAAFWSLHRSLAPLAMCFPGIWHLRADNPLHFSFVATQTQDSFLGNLWDRRLLLLFRYLSDKRQHCDLGVRASLWEERVSERARRPETWWAIQGSISLVRLISAKYKVKCDSVDIYSTGSITKSSLILSRLKNFLQATII